MNEKKIENNSVFKERLRTLMKETKVTQQSLADALKTSRKTVSLWCIGYAVPDKFNIERLTEYFGVSKEWFFGESDKRDERKEMLAKFDRNFSFSPFLLRFVETIEDLSGKTLMFEEDGDSFEEYVSDCIKECLSIAEKKGIEMQDRKSIIRRKKR